MKEKDIVDFTKMEQVDENGNEVGCEICYTHKKAYEKLDDEFDIRINIHPKCPKCGNQMYEEGEGIVSEGNYSIPDGEIGLYPIFCCPECNEYFAYIPEQISYNANHDIYYTGGRDYLEDEDHKKLLKDIFKKIEPSIEQYIRRVVDEHEVGLNMWNIKLWCERDVEAAIANWLYEHKLKK